MEEFRTRLLALLVGHIVILERLCEQNQIGFSLHIYIIIKESFRFHLPYSWPGGGGGLSGGGGGNFDTAGAP